MVFLTVETDEPMNRETDELLKCFPKLRYYPDMVFLNKGHPAALTFRNIEEIE